MKKAIIILVSIGGFLIFSWIILRLTHTIDVYNIPTTSNLPTYPPGTLIVASRFKDVKNGSFVCFREPIGHAIWVFRCIAKDGDVVEMKNSEVYVNGKLLNEPYTWNEYYITSKQLHSIQGYVDQNKYPVRVINDSLSVITFSANELKTYHFNLKHFLATKEQETPEIYKDFKNKGYNEDNFGPVKVPADSYFLLGDNRHDAMDSRYIGFIKKSEIVSTVLSH